MEENDQTMTEVDDQDSQSQGTPLEGFVARMNNYKILKQFCTAVNVNSDGNASVYMKANGLKMTVEDAKTFQANAFLDHNIFNEFTYTPEDDVGLNLNIPSILDVLNLFGAKNDYSDLTVQGQDAQGQTVQGQTQTSMFSISPLTSLVLHYGKYGDPFTLWLEEDGLVTRAALPTRDLEETLMFDFTKPNLNTKVVLQADPLKELFNEIDLSGDYLEISVNADRNSFGFTTFGSSGDVFTEVPNDSDMVHSFECRKTAKAKFPMTMIKYALKSIHMASKVSLRMDQQQILCLQYLIQFETGQCFLEYFFTPQIETEVETQSDD